MVLSLGKLAHIIFKKYKNISCIVVHFLSIYKKAEIQRTTVC